jgi:hypothetical protein
MRDAIRGTHKKFPYHEIMQATATSPRSMLFAENELEALLDYRYKQPYTFTLLALLYPWVKYDQHFHIDHIFPQSYFTESQLSKRGIVEDKRHFWLEHKDELANLQLLQGVPNQEKSNREFATWLKETHPTKQDQQSYYQLHMIPPGELTFSKFPQFMKARRAIMKRKLADLLGQTQ